MRVDLFEYELPAERIAQEPTRDRDGARLLCVPQGDGPFAHAMVRDLPRLLPEGALLVLNDTRVIPARLLGEKKGSGGRLEIFLVRRLGGDGDMPMQVPPAPNPDAPACRWAAMGRASKPLRPGLEFLVSKRLHGRILGRLPDEELWEVELWAPSESSVEQVLRDVGRMPLPPYIKRDVTPQDSERYQTVFARSEGAVAAPTAGLHLTPSLLDQIRKRGCSMTTITLHVGLGTFRNVTVDDLDQHPMHGEAVEVPPATVATITEARRHGRPVVAVGTTVVRALESAADPERRGHVRPFAGETRLLIQPGFDFRVVDALFTNFHAPRSTLMALVSAFGGHERLRAAYKEAIAQEYRFLSYGDAMFLSRTEP